VLYSDCKQFLSMNFICLIKCLIGFHGEIILYILVKNVRGRRTYIYFVEEIVRDTCEICNIMCEKRSNISSCNPFLGFFHTFLVVRIADLPSFDFLFRLCLLTQIRQLMVPAYHLLTYSLLYSVYLVII